MSELSRQRKWQLAHKAAGLCTNCPLPALPNMIRCEACHNKMMRHVRRIQNNKTRRPNTKLQRALEQLDAKA